MSSFFHTFFDLGNQDHLPPGELPKHYQGEKYWQYFNKEETWFDDSNIFGNPFEEPEGPSVYDDDDMRDPVKPLKKSNSYEILGVDKDADEDEIRKAFRKKALETHPDRGGKKEDFVKVREAYECLIS
jgi:hypothetical protein